MTTLYSEVARLVGSDFDGTPAQGNVSVSADGNTLAQLIRSI